MVTILRLRQSSRTCLQRQPRIVQSLSSEVCKCYKLARERHLGRLAHLPTPDVFLLLTTGRNRRGTENGSCGTSGALLLLGYPGEAPNQSAGQVADVAGSAGGAARTFPSTSTTAAAAVTSAPRGKPAAMAAATVRAGAWIAERARIFTQESAEPAIGWSPASIWSASRQVPRSAVAAVK